MKVLNKVDGKGRFVQYDNRATYLPDATKLGYAKYQAKAGDLLILKDGSLARVIGRIAEHDAMPAKEGPDGWPAEGTKAHAGNLLVCQVGSSFTFGMERWISPSEVAACYAPERAARFLAWFFSATPEELAFYIREDVETRLRVHDLIEGSNLLASHLKSKAEAEESARKFDEARK